MAELNQGEQPLVLDEQDVVRFRQNRIVRMLLDVGPLDLNQLAIMPFTDEERQIFAQLIGYSVSGYGDLSYVDSEAVARADAAQETFLNDEE